MSDHQIPPPSDPRRAQIADVLIDMNQQGYHVITAAMMFDQGEREAFLAFVDDLSEQYGF